MKRFHLHRSAPSFLPTASLPSYPNPQHLVFSIPRVKILRNEIIDGQRVRRPCLSSRLVLNLHMTREAGHRGQGGQGQGQGGQGGLGGQGEVWQSYEAFEALQRELQGEFAHVKVPGLVDFNQLVEDYSRNFGERGLKTLLSPIFSQRERELEDAHLIFLASLQVLNFLSLLQLSPLLCSSPSLPRFLSLSSSSFPSFPSFPSSFPLSPSLRGRRPPSSVRLIPQGELVQDRDIGERTRPFLSPLPLPLLDGDEEAGWVGGLGGHGGGLAEQGESKLKSFLFADQSERERGLVRDCSLSQSFKVRGPGYLSDKLKIPAEGPCFQFIGAELLEVSKEIGERQDHVSLCRGVRRRILSLLALPEVESIFLLNMQLPGSPPLSAVFYFAVPKQFFTEKKLKRVRELYKRFRDIPYSLSPSIHSSSASLSLPLSASSLSNPSLSPTPLLSNPPANPSASLPSSLPTSPPTPTPAPAPPTTTARSWVQDIVWPPVGDGVLGREAFQNKRFKLIPCMGDAPWVVKGAVSSTPCLLGQKIVMRYFRGKIEGEEIKREMKIDQEREGGKGSSKRETGAETGAGAGTETETESKAEKIESKEYLELDMHVGSSSIAEKIVSVCRSYSTLFVCDLGVVLQGEEDGELPELLLATLQLHKIDLTVRRKMEM